MENEKNLKINENKCPFCGSILLDWWDSEDDGFGYIVWKCGCDECGKEWKVYYKINFDGISYKDENGTTHDFNAEGKEI